MEKEPDLTMSAGELDARMRRLGLNKTAMAMLFSVKNLTAAAWLSGAKPVPPHVAALAIMLTVSEYDVGSPGYTAALDIVNRYKRRAPFQKV